jgi:transcriptional regulator with XRE-family HTH domain
MTPEQCRAARGLLGWTQAELAARADVHSATVRGFENMKKVPQRASIAVMRRIMEENRVRFEERDGAVGVWLALQDGDA